MPQYKAFISYRKSSSVNADLIKSTLVDKYAYSNEEIFLDKHNIGTDFFNKKITQALNETSCLLLLVSKECFQKRDVGEDWFIAEINYAISHRIPIIPVFFDNIKSLSDDDIFNDLKICFSEEQIDYLTKSQGLRYDFDLSEQTFQKIDEFIAKINNNKTPFYQKCLNGFRLLSTIAFIIAIFFFLCFGIGALWGYFTSSTDEVEVIADNTKVVGNNLIFEYGGWTAIYDLDKDSVVVDPSFNNKVKESRLESIIASCSFSGALTLFDKNMSSLKLLKYIKGGSKPAQITKVTIIVGVCLGSFCGFSQGSLFGRQKKQSEVALKMYPKLQDKLTWKPLMSEYFPLKALSNHYENYYFVWIIPLDQNTVAYKNGIQDSLILLKFNEWDVRTSSFEELWVVRDNSMQREKDIVCLNPKDGNITHYILPQDTIGVLLSGTRCSMELLKDIVKIYNQHSITKISN